MPTKDLHHIIISPRVKLIFQVFIREKNNWHLKITLHKNKTITDTYLHIHQALLFSSARSFGCTSYHQVASESMTTFFVPGFLVRLLVTDRVSGHVTWFPTVFQHFYFSHSHQDDNFLLCSTNEGGQSSHFILVKPDLFC